MKHLFSFIAITSLFSCTAGEAEDSANSFANRHFENHKGVECMSYDTDDDGYVSCSVFMADKIIPIECATNHYGCGNSGCRGATGKNRR